MPSAAQSGRDYLSPAGSFFAPQPLRSGNVAFMYGDGSSPYIGLGRDLHRQRGQSAVFGGAELTKPASSLGYRVNSACSTLEEPRSHSPPALRG